MHHVRRRLGCVMLAMCGVMRTRGWRQNACVGRQRLGVGDVEHGLARAGPRRAPRAGRPRPAAAPRPTCTSAGAARQLREQLARSGSRASRRSAAAGRRGCRCARESASSSSAPAWQLHAVDRVARAAPAGAVEAEADERGQHRLAERAQAEHADAPLGCRPAPAAAAIRPAAAGARYSAHVAMQRRAPHGVTYSTMPPMMPGSTMRTTGSVGGSAAKSNWSTPAPEENSSSRFGNALARSAGGSQAARKRTRAGSPMSGQRRKSSSGAARANTSAHCRPRSGSAL